MPTNIDTHDLDATSGAVYFAVGRGTEGGPASYHLAIAGITQGVTELAETLGTTPEQIALAIRAALPTLSLTPVDDEDGLREFDVPVESPEEALSDRIGLAEVMDRLDSGDRQLIRLRFFAGRTQSETARVLGTTQVQISRRERRILKWMREQLLEAQ